MIFDFLSDVVVQTVLITFFVLSMIMVLEFLNVRTEGHVNDFMQRHSNLQILLSAVLGILPGCLGSYTAVSLYTHDVIGFGALMANLIATTGDEAIYMISFMSGHAWIVFGILFVIAVLSGYAINFWARRGGSSLGQENHFVLHRSHDHHISLSGSVSENFKNISLHRVILIVSVIVFIVLTLCGVLEEHDVDEAGHGGEGDAVKYTFLVLSSFSLYVLAKVPNHFLEEHIWHHVISKHFLKVLIWTAITLVVIFIIKNVVDIEDWVSQFSADKVYWFCVVAAVLIGLIPESGPHVIFISLYLTGVMPFGALLANCIVQDGHGAIPLLAESKKDFFLVKGIKLGMALLVALAFYCMH